MNDWRWYRRRHRRWTWFYIILASAWILWAAFCRPSHRTTLKHVTERSGAVHLQAGTEASDGFVGVDA